jgi:hypothetical protein
MGNTSGLKIRLDRYTFDDFIKTVMVFGWGKIKQESQEQIQTKSTVSINEIDSLLATHKEEKRNQIITKSKPLFSEIQRELSAIYKIIEHLQNDSLKVDDIEKILRVIVVRAKTDVIDVISKESKKTLPQVSTYDDVLKTSDETSYTLKKIGDVLGKNTRVIHVFAKKYAQDLKDHLERVTQNHAFVTKMIGDYSALDASSGLIKDMISKISAATQDIQYTTNHVSILRDSYNTSQSLYSTTQTKITELRSSSKHLEFLELKNKIKQIKSQEELLDKEIDDEFSKVSRPLGKYVYVTSLDKSLKAILERLVQRPSQVIATESKESIVLILESCMRGILSGTVSVKETDKSVDQITNLIRMLDSLVSKKNNVLSQIQEIEKKSISLDNKDLELLEKQLTKSKSDSEDAQLKIKNLESEIAQKIMQKEKLIKDLQSSLERVLGVKYEVML